MDIIENIEDQSETLPVFLNAMNIIEEEGMITEMLYPVQKTSNIYQLDNRQEWKQWTRQDENINIQTCIQEDRKFLFDEKHQHMWYKNINLPTITMAVKHESYQGVHLNVRLDCFGVQVSEEQEANNSESKDYENPTLIGGYKRFFLEGEGIQQTILSQKQQIIFQRIKCKETSYNNKGLRFYIMLYVYEQETNKPILIRLSPSLYIESRKKSFQETQTQLGFAHPFMPEALTKSYAKCSKLLNQESIESFSEYYSSCSIRHKIIHPLFLFLKFFKGVKLYYNKNMIDENIEQKEGSAGLFLQLQCQIYNQIQKEQSSKNYTGSSDNKASKIKLPKMSFFPVLGLTVNYESLPLDRKIQKKIYKKVLRFVKPLVGSILQVYFQLKDIPNCMKEINYQEHMKEDYKQIYNQLADLKAKKSYVLGPSNTQYSHPQHKFQNHLLGQSVNKQCDETSSNDNHTTSQNQEKKNYNLIKEVKYKSKEDQYTSNSSVRTFNNEDILLKKRPLNQIQKFVTSPTSEGEEDKLQTYNNDKTENGKQLINIKKQQQNILIKQNVNNNMMKKFKKNSEQDHVSNSFQSNKNSEQNEFQKEDKNAGVCDTSLINSRKETLCKYPDINLNSNKENSGFDQTQIVYSTDHNSQTTIHQEQIQTPQPQQVVHQIYQIPQGGAIPFQNPYHQQIILPINPYNPQEQSIPHISNIPTPLNIPPPVQFVMNPYQYQNFYYPYNGYTYPIQAQPQIIAQNMNYPYPGQIIAIQPNSSQFQTQIIKNDTQIQKQQFVEQ